MKERPIIFSAPMVRALLAGNKTQTRRAIKPQPEICDHAGDGWAAAHYRQQIPTEFFDVGGGNWACRTCGEGIRLDLPEGSRGIRCPYGEPGNRLWVREAFKPIASGQIKDGFGKVRYGYAYKADSSTIWAPNETIIHDLTGRPPTGAMQFQETPWKSPIHMPHRASRILLEVTAVRLARLQDISEADAQAEGVEPVGVSACDVVQYGALCGSPFRFAYAKLWAQINGIGSWEANPWVWAVSFKRVVE